MDDSHTNLEWKSELQSFVRSGFGTQGKLKLALNIAELKYQVFEDDNLLAELALNSKTEMDAVAWFKEILKEKGMDVSSFTMEKHYEIPLTDQAQGKPYDLFDTAVFEALSDHFDIAHRVLTEIATAHKNSTPIRCWPHHFDLGILIILQENENPEEMKSVGLGLSPGDGSYNQPYYYVSPWPYPDKSKLNNNDLPEGGFWHSEGFTSAILLADSYLKYQDTEKSIFDFLVAAIQINTRLII